MKTLLLASSKIIPWIGKFLPFLPNNYVSSHSILLITKVIGCVWWLIKWLVTLGQKWEKIYILYILPSVICDCFYFAKIMSSFLKKMINTNIISYICTNYLYLAVLVLPVMKDGLYSDLNIFKITQEIESATGRYFTSNTWISIQ